MSFLIGLGLGLSTALITGPVFFTLLKNSIQYGHKEGIAAATGIVISDLLVFWICSFAAGPFLKQTVENPFAYVFAGMLMLAFGIRFVVRPVKVREDEENGLSGHKTVLSALSQGFLVNFVNPMVFLIWMGFIAYGEKEFQTTLPFYLYTGGILLGIYTTDLLKVFFAQKIKLWIKSEHIRIMYRIIGTILILFSIRLFIHSI